jgi:hypothetical protein
MMSEKDREFVVKAVESIMPSRKVATDACFAKPGKTTESSVSMEKSRTLALPSTTLKTLQLPHYRHDTHSASSREYRRCAW